MEENKQDMNLTEDQENKTADKKTRHTWIGDADEIRPDYTEERAPRTTYQDILECGTRLMERERKAYTGFITDEEVRTAEAAAEIDRRAREENRAARANMQETRIYRGFGSSINDAEPEKEPAPEKQPEKRRSRSVRIRVIDGGKFKRLIAVFAVFALLILFELSYAGLKYGASALPQKTAGLRGSIATQQANNAELQKKNDELGEYDDLKELRDSWQTTRNKLAE